MSKHAIYYHGLEIDRFSCDRNCRDSEIDRHWKNPSSVFGERSDIHGIMLLSRSSESLEGRGIVIVAKDVGGGRKGTLR
jgi:hypothetical protein